MDIDGNYCKFDSQKQYKCDYSIFSWDVSLNCIDLIFYSDCVTAIAIALDARNNVAFNIIVITTINNRMCI